MPPTVAPFQVDQEFLNNACHLPEAVADTYVVAQKYYDGVHSTRLTDRARRYLTRSGWDFSENFCEPVIDVMAERLAVTGFALEDKGGGQSAGEQDDQTVLAQWLDGVLQRNRLDSKQRTLHSAALIKGDGWLVVDFENVRRIPRLTFNKPELIKPCYSPDEPDQLEWVAKRWNSRAEGAGLNMSRVAIVRLNLYYPDRLEKYFKVSADDADPNSSAGSWQQWQDDGDGAWPVKWVDAVGAPLGIPIFHFRHKPLGQVHGRSELRGVIPQQDALNKQIIDLNEILDYQASPQRWLSGVVATDDSLKPGPGEYLVLSSENAKAGQFDAADLQQVVAAVDATISRLARRSRTPLHLLVGGTTPSGEALKVAEAGLVAKVEASQVDFGQSWEDVALMMLRLGQSQGVVAVPNLDDLVAQAQWDSAKTRDELGEAQRAQLLHDLGVSQRTLLTELGYDPDQEQENRDMEQAALAQATGGLLDRGSADAYNQPPPVSTPQHHITLQMPAPPNSKRTISYGNGKTATITDG